MRLGALLEMGDVICLEGELGAGKTTLVQGIALGWGSLDKVSSPTYVLVNVYRRPDEARLVHLDAYRLNGAAEAEALDIDNLLVTGPVVVEWAPRIRGALPEENLWVKMDWIDDERRSMQFSADGQRYEKLLDGLQARMFGV